LFAANYSGNSAIGPRLDTGGWLTLTETITGFFPTGTFTLQDTPSFARRDNVQAQGLAGFVPLDFDLSVNLAVRLNFEKPRCPPVPCSALLYFF
jgi:hypothetical protein